MNIPGHTCRGKYLHRRGDTVVLRCQSGHVRRVYDAPRPAGYVFYLPPAP